MLRESGPALGSNGRPMIANPTRYRYTSTQHISAWAKSAMYRRLVVVVVAE